MQAVAGVAMRHGPAFVKACDVVNLLFSPHFARLSRVPCSARMSFTPGQLRDFMPARVPVTEGERAPGRRDSHGRTTHGDG